MPMKFYKDILRPLLSFLNQRDKKSGLGVVALMMLNALLDFFSLASFLPLIFLLVNPNFISSNKQINAIYTVFGFTSPSWFIIAFTGCILTFVVFKNSITLWITRAKANYCFTMGSSLSSRMLTLYLEMSYLKFTQSDYTKELNRIANLPIAFANNIIMPLANLLAEGLVFLILFVCIGFYDGRIFTLLTIVLMPIGLIHFLRRNDLSQTSAELKVKYPLTLKYALQVVEGFVDIIAFRKQSFFKKRFDQTSQDLAKIFSRDYTNQTNASRLTEIIAALIICFLIVYSVFSNQNYQQTILLLGIYAGASFRMIPSLNRMLNALTQIKSHQYLFSELGESTNLKIRKNQKHASALQFTKTIEIRDVSFHYPNGAIVLQGASLTIHKGDKIALVGKSGEGKTTLLMLLLQFIKTDSGKIFLDRTEIKDENLMEWRKLFSYVPQSPYILDGTIAENIAFGFSAEEINHEKIQQLILDLDLGEMIVQLPNGLFTPIGEKGIKLSGGQRQRIAIARALYADAEILLFDEITNQLDRQSEQEIIQTLEKIDLQKKTILMITHHSHLLNHFDRMLTLENGRLSEKKLHHNFL